MTEKTNVPEIRFAGFTDPWEQRKFADFVTASGIRNSENLELPSYSVTNDRGFVPQDEQFENGGTMREADKTSYWIVEPKSFAYNPARINVGSIGYQSTSRNVIVSSLYEVFQADETCDNRFLWHWFKTRLFTQQIEMLQEGGVRLYFFFDKLLKSGISMPSVDEQRLIGEQFDRIDHLITLHQRKHEKLVQLKKSMLDKMFPKPGETEPEIRFAGFTDPWEQRKLGELIQLGGSGGTPSANNPDYYGGDIPFLSIADINGRDITNTAKTLTDEGLQNSAAWIVPSGAVSLAMYASVGKVGIIRQDTATSQAFYNMVFDNEALRDFVFTRLEKAETDSEWEPYISTGTQRNLNADKVKSFSLDVPSNEEASEISAYFANLDTLITLHQ